MKIVLKEKESIHNVYKATKGPKKCEDKPATVLYKEPNQSTKSTNNKQPFSIYILTQSQKRYKKELFTV